MQRNKHYKKHNNYIFPIVFLVSIPVLIYLLFSKANMQYISQVCADAKDKLSIVSTQEVEEIKAKLSSYEGLPQKTYVLGNVGNEYDWTLPYLVSGAQYGGYSHPDKVAYCVDLLAPTIVRVDRVPAPKGGINRGIRRGSGGGNWGGYLIAASSGFNAGTQMVYADVGGGGGGSPVSPRTSFSIDDSNEDSVIFANNSKNPAYQEIYYDADKYVDRYHTQYDEPLPSGAEELWSLAGEHERLAKTIAFALYRNEVTTIKNLAKENAIVNLFNTEITPKVNNIFSNGTTTITFSQYRSAINNVFPSLIPNGADNYDCLTTALVDDYSGKTANEINNDANLTDGEKAALISYISSSTDIQKSIDDYLVLKDIELNFFYDSNYDLISDATINSADFEEICSMVLSAIIDQYKIEQLPYSYGEIQQLVWNNNYWTDQIGGYINNYAEYIPEMHGSSFYDTVEYNDNHEVTPYVVVGYQEYTLKTGEKKMRRIGRGGKVDDHDMVIAEQYATWAYQILGEDNRVDLQFYPYKEKELETDSNKELTVEVDQETKSYLIGPYRVDLLNDAGESISNQFTCNGHGTQRIADFIFSEMAGEQSGVKTLDEAFATGTFTVNIWNRGDSEPTVYSTPKKHDGLELVFDMDSKQYVQADFSRLFVANQKNAVDYTNFYTTPRTDTITVNGIEVTQNFKETNRIVITDANGKALDYAFPKFGEEFYIRYYPEDYDTKTIEYIQPSLYFRYLDGHFRVSATGYASAGVRFGASRSVLWNAPDTAKKNTVLNLIRKAYQDKGISNLRLWNKFQVFEPGDSLGGIFYNSGTYAKWSESSNSLIGNGLLTTASDVSTNGLREAWVQGLESAVGKSNSRARDDSGEPEKPVTGTVEFKDTEGGPTGVENDYSDANDVITGIFLMPDSGQKAVETKMKDENFNGYYFSDITTANQLLKVLESNYKIEVTSDYVNGDYSSYSTATGYADPTMSKLSADDVSDSAIVFGDTVYETKHWYGNGITNCTEDCPEPENTTSGDDNSTDDNSTPTPSPRPGGGGSTNVEQSYDPDNHITIKQLEADYQDFSIDKTYSVSHVDNTWNANGWDDADCPCSDGCDCEGDVTYAYHHSTYTRDVSYKKNTNIKCKITFYRNTTPTGGHQLEIPIYVDLTEYSASDLAAAYVNTPSVTAPNYIPETNTAKAAMAQAMNAKLEAEKDKILDKAIEKLRKWFKAYAGVYIPISDGSGTSYPMINDTEFATEMQPVISNMHLDDRASWQVQAQFENHGEIEQGTNVSEWLTGWTKKQINQYLGGNVSETIEGIRGDDNRISKVGFGAGMEVTLIDCYNGKVAQRNIVAITTTDANGNYGFQHLNPLHRYEVQFRYNGMQYIEDGGIVTNISDGTNDRYTATEAAAAAKATGLPTANNLRSVVNARFANITPANNNYENNKVYGWLTKLRNSNGEFIESNNTIEVVSTSTDPNYSTEEQNYNLNANALRYCDVYEKFRLDCVHTAYDRSNINSVVSTYVSIPDTFKTNNVVNVTKDKVYEDIIEGQFTNELNDLLGTNLVEEGFNEASRKYSEVNNIKKFMKDTFVISFTENQFPSNGDSKFFLEDIGTSPETANSYNANTTMDKAHNDLHNNYHRLVYTNPFNTSNGVDVYALYNDAAAVAGSTIPGSDQSRNVDFVIRRRPISNVTVRGDISKATIRVNGKTSVYKYNGLSFVGDEYLTPVQIARDTTGLADNKRSYTRVITESAYLYTGAHTLGGPGSERNLRLFITYSVIVKNTGHVPITVNNLVDYYDAYYLERNEDCQLLDIDYATDGFTRAIVNSGRLSDNEISVSGETSPNNQNPYEPQDKTQIGTLDIPQMYNSLYISNVGTLEVDEVKKFNITFEQKKDEFGRLRLTQNLLNGKILSGDKNIIEVDSYSQPDGIVTEFSTPGNLCPKDFHNSGDHNGFLINDNPNPLVYRGEPDTWQYPDICVIVPSIKPELLPSISGSVFEDVRSITNKKAVTGNGIFNPNDKDVADNNIHDKLIDGVTVELIEYVKKVNERGQVVDKDGHVIQIVDKSGEIVQVGEKDPSGNPYTEGTYERERIVTTDIYKLEDLAKDPYYANKHDYTEDGDMLHLVSLTLTSEGTERYATGTNKAQVLLDVDRGYLKIRGSDREKITENDADAVGLYKYLNVAPGDYAVRFIYGDTTETVLTNDPNNEVNQLLSAYEAPISQDQIYHVTHETEDASGNYTYPDNYGFIDETESNGGIIGLQGKNATSYNGNDYKSTIYQAEKGNNNSIISQIDQSAINNTGLTGFTPGTYDTKNVTEDNGYEMMIIKGPGLNDKYKQKLYGYSNALADAAKEGLSDAKDIAAYRQIADNYAKGYFKDNATNSEIQATVINNSSTANSNPITLRNFRAEVMDSFAKIGTYATNGLEGDNLSSAGIGAFAEKTAGTPNAQSARQIEMLKELIKNTRMVAQSGVLSMEVEYDTMITDYGGDNSLVNTDTSSTTDPGILHIPEDVPIPWEGYFDLTRTGYEAKNLNLGLTKRPEAAIKLNKEVSNVQIVLNDGSTLFDATQSVDDLYFSQHHQHEVYYKNMRLTGTKVSTNTYNTPDLIQIYIDDELIAGSRLTVKYKFTAENVSEVDYLDKQFYYTGDPVTTAESNVVRTNIDELIDYVSNNDKYETSLNNTEFDLITTQNVGLALKNPYVSWKVMTAVPQAGAAVDEATLGNYIYPYGISRVDYEKITQTGSVPGTPLSSTYLIDGPKSANRNLDLVNREYFPQVDSYDTLITTNNLSVFKYEQKPEQAAWFRSEQQVSATGKAYTFGLLPKKFFNSTSGNEYKYSTSTALVLSTVLSNSSNDNLIYPNLCEVVRISNSVGRRCTYSTVGNQPMADQNYGDDQETIIYNDPMFDKYSKYTAIDTVTPIEIDADSSQSVRILPPTGFNKNNTAWMMAVMGSFAIIVAAIFIIKSGLDSGKKRRSSNIKRWR